MRQDHGRYGMRMDGGSTLRYGTYTQTLDHRQGAALSRRLGLHLRIPQRTRHGARLTVPMAALVTHIRACGSEMPRGMAGRIETQRLLRMSQGLETSASITLHDLDATCDLGTTRPDDASMESAADATDDPTLSRLLEMNGVGSLVRGVPGVDLFWGGMEERQTSFGSANPYHRLTGLPDDLPPFMMRRAWGDNPSCIAITFGNDASTAAIYCQEQGEAWLGISHQLPQTVIAQLPGRPATDIVGHASLEGWNVTAPFEHGPDDTPTAFHLEWRC